MRVCPRAHLFSCAFATMPAAIAAVRLYASRIHAVRHSRGRSPRHVKMTPARRRPREREEARRAISAGASSARRTATAQCCRFHAPRAPSMLTLVAVAVSAFFFTPAEAPPARCHGRSELWRVAVRRQERCIGELVQNRFASVISLARRPLPTFVYFLSLRRHAVFQSFAPRPVTPFFSHVAGVVFHFLPRACLPVRRRRHCLC